MRSALAAALLAALLLPACGDDDPIDCETNADCSQAGIPGTCLPSPASSSMWCAFPDNSCDDSHQRWGILSGDGLASECVEGSEPDAGTDAEVPDASTEPDAVELPDAGEGVPPDMAEIGAGLFKRGCTAGAGCGSTFSDALPFQDITLSKFWIDRDEVTQAAYQACITTTACSSPAANFDPGATPTLPVVNVTWTQAVEYCAFKGGRRLPTEAEWEKAARYTDGRTFPWGEAAPDCTRAFYFGCPGAGVGADPKPVGSLPTGDSPYGVHDMAGNVSEWTADWYDNSYYQVAPTVDPTGPASGNTKVYRGGNMASAEAFLRTYKRRDTSPANQFDFLGFRCAKTP